ncbi:Lacal_2735 family protein [Formosa sediminum]|uniref:Lacal_2735 family protein n=1 Tax=Formosa sediminum TaxID=2594004 RepID=A0A516GLR2_9FLAO|nr:Lacal_2735 family protein [Formosa sediminum]QDO92463.1 Lacal_2735 family protein [Formosa sediminum]
MNRYETIKKNQQRLFKRYKQLIEQAYNFRQTDSEISDISDFQAIKILNKLNRLKYLQRGEQHIPLQ